MNDFRNIWMPLSDRFYRAAYYMLESQQDAEDAVQELYLKLWRSRESLNGLNNPVAYALSLLKNICVDRIRRREIRKAEPLDFAAPPESPSLDRQMSSKDLLKFVLTEIDNLPDRQAEVMKMMALEGQDYKEISKRTGLSQVHVRVLISTARKTLKRKLKI